MVDRRFLPRTDIAFGALLLPLGALIGFVTIWPLFRLAFELYKVDPVPLHFIIKNLTKPATIRALKNTIDAAFWSSMLALGVGLSAVLIIDLTDIRFKTAAAFLVLLPILIPSQITVLAWKALVSFMTAQGSANPLYSRNGVILILGIENSSVVFLAIHATVRSISRDLIEAARISGAKPFYIIRSIILPLLSPGILAGFSLSFVAAIGNFGVPALLGIPGRFPVLTTLIYQRLNGFGPNVLGEMVVLSLPLLLLSSIMLFFRFLISKNVSKSIQRSSSSLLPFTLGQWRLAVEIAVGLLFILLSIIPLISLAISSVIPSVGMELSVKTLTLAHYRLILTLDSIRRAFFNSFRLSLGTALVLVVFSLPLAYLSNLRKVGFARFLDTIANLPYAIPGIVLSIAMILGFIKPLPIIGSLYNSFWILFIAYLSRFFALALRTTTSAMEQFDLRLEEAAQVSGAGILRRLITVIIPAAAASSAAGALMVFMTAANELTLSSLLWSTGNETIGVMIYALQYEGNSPGASAVSMVSISIILLIAGLLSYFGKYLPDGVVPWRV